MKPNQYLLMLSGPSGSGKSTHAAKLKAQDSNNIMILNRDSIRKFVGLDWSNDVESMIIKPLQKEMAKLFVVSNYNLIIDDTNLTDYHKNYWKSFASEWKVIFKTYDMECRIEDCISRDEGRVESVGRPVIERQFLQWGKPFLEDKPTLIVDIDGTIADHTNIRNIYDMSHVHLDRPILATIARIRELSRWYRIIYMTGRNNSSFEGTVYWLKKYDLPIDHIYMRMVGDRQPATTLKSWYITRILTQISTDNIVVYEDSIDNIEMFKSFDLEVVQCGPEGVCNEEQEVK